MTQGWASGQYLQSGKIFIGGDADVAEQVNAGELAGDNLLYGGDAISIYLAGDVVNGGPALQAVNVNFDGGDASSVYGADQIIYGGGA